MAFWLEVAAGFLANVFAGFLLVGLYVAIQWFLQVTDITIGYNWRSDGTMLRPSFDVRNLSRSRTYVLSNIAYLRKGKPVASFDNKTVWGTELKPGAIAFVEGLPIPLTLEECMKTEVHVRLQGKRMFWLQGRRPGQERLKGWLHRTAFWLRDRLERMAFPWNRGQVASGAGNLDASGSRASVGKDARAGARAGFAWLRSYLDMAFHVIDDE
jgi:hypothetical protein